MKRLPKLRTGLLLLAAAVCAACADEPQPLAPTEPGNDASFVIMPDGPQPVVLRDWLERDLYASAWIGSNGGRLSAGGVTLTIPEGALDERVRIQLLAPRGTSMLVWFEPHGLVFERPATIAFDLSESSVEDAAANGGKDLVGVYYEGDAASEFIVPLETYPVTVDGSTGSFQIEHFSGYTMAGGR